MASIPGPIYLIIGIFISVTSYFLNKKSFSFISAYSLFLYLGIIIFTYGLIKSIIWYMTRKSPKEIEEDLKKDIAQKEAEIKSKGYAFNQIQNTEEVEERYRMVIRCTTCGMNHYIYSNFCSNCGTRLIK